MNRSDRSSTTSKLSTAPGLRFAVRMPYPARDYAPTNFTSTFPQAKPWFFPVLAYPAVTGWVTPKGETTGYQEHRALFNTRDEATRAAKPWIDPQIVEVWLC